MERGHYPLSGPHERCVGYYIITSTNCDFNSGT